MTKKKASPPEVVRAFDYEIDCTRKILHPRTGEVVPIAEGSKEPCTIGFVFGTLLSEERSTYFKPMRSWILAQRFFQNELVGLDADDFQNCKKALDESSHWLPFVIGQTTEYLESLTRQE